MNRRTSLETLVATTAGVLTMKAKSVPLGKDRSDRLGDRLPMRPFGRSGEMVTQLGVGGYHVGHADDEGMAQDIIETALAEGIRFFDMAPSYQDGRAEHRYGKFLTPNYRDDIFLMTKTKARTGAELTAELETSLARMKTDYVDAFLLHAMNDAEDAEERMSGGVLDALMKAKEQGKVRYVGFSGHLNTSANLRMLELMGDQVDVTLMPVNAVDPSDKEGLCRKVLPRLNEMGVAPLAMKTAAFGNFFMKSVKIEGVETKPIIPARVTMEEAFQFVLSQSISCWVSGMDRPEYVVRNARIARNSSRN